MSDYNELDAWAGNRPPEYLEGKSEEESRKWSVRKRIYLEGKTDYEIIAVRWFHSDDKIEFRTHEDDSGGCKWVLKQVEEQNGSFGIIDRDYLLNPEHYDLFFEINDEVYKEKAPFGQNVLILSRYEIENYLVDVPHLLRIMINRRRNTYNGRTIRNESELYEILLNISLKISSVDAICSVFRLFREEIPGKVKGLYFDKNSADEVVPQVNGLLRKWIEEDCEILYEPGHTNLLNCLCECYEQLTDRYYIFSSNEEDPINRRFLSLLRIVDGKRLLGLITRSFKMHDPIEYDLADYIVNSDAVPIEIDVFINSIHF
jgi:hypothetical protein